MGGSRYLTSASPCSTRPPSLTVCPVGLMGTPDYIAPEQVTAPSEVDGRADIYSLGCTFYHLLTGRAPFKDIVRPAKSAAHLTQEPPPVELFRPGIPDGLCSVVRKMMAKRLEDRYQAAAEAAEAL